MMIRKAALDDSEKIYRLLCELENEELPINSFKEVFLENLKNPRVNYLVCENENNIVAFASLHIQSLLHHCSKAAEIQELIVQEKQKGNGIGKKLFDEMVSIAQENNCSILEVCCNQKRIPSHKFYEHCGMLKSHYKFTYPLD
ncbi:MAG TPA: GNAT family N-acetyltransferase [Oscillospiraceae bacterium]|nr:GNAT family N-acetyltransferase [Oscillospiraceae bacterium]